MDKMYIIHLIERMDYIINKYKCIKTRKDGNWIYYKRIPSRYWHEMMEAYFVFRGIIEDNSCIFENELIIVDEIMGNGKKRRGLRFSYDDKKKMELYVRLLPGLSQFDKCKGVRKFNIFRQFVYDRLHCLID